MHDIDFVPKISNGINWNSGAPVLNAPPGTEPHYEIIKRTSNEPDKSEMEDIYTWVPGDSRYSSIASMRSGTMQIPFSMPGEEDLDIVVTVYYRPACYHFQRHEYFRFVTRAALDGQIHWVPRPE
jgi:hypothetical protein